jgi:thiol-disulfide isomerase/thioredoxin
MEIRPRIKTLIVVSLLALLILSACQRVEITEESPSLQSSTASAYPSPLEPDVGVPTGVAYPAPEAIPTTDLTQEAYPQPGSEAAPAPSATQNSTPTTSVAPSATSQDAYPPPEATQEPSNGAYPGPESDDVLMTPGSSAQPTIVQGIPTEELTPTVTPTLGLLRTELVATDPQSFRIVSGEFQLVEFFAFWSPECQSMAPVMNVLEQRYDDRLRFIYLDIDDPANSLFKTLLNNRLPPVFFLLDGEGKILHEWQGYVELEAFETAIAELVP